MRTLALAILVPVAVLLMAAPATATVPSPYTFLDPIGDAGPSVTLRLDLTAVEVRLRPNDMDLRFRVLRHPARVSSVGYWFVIDRRSNGIGDDYLVVVQPHDSSIAVYAYPYPRLFPPTCSSHNVTDLGANQWGRGFSARFRYQCVGGRGSMRLEMDAVDGTRSLDRAPDEGYTPYIRP